MGAGAAGKSDEKESESGVFHIFLATWYESVGLFDWRRGPTASNGFLSDETLDPALPIPARHALEDEYPNGRRSMIVLRTTVPNNQTSVFLSSLLTS
jgi:hypothetical protein